MAIDTKYVESSCAELRDLFQPWITRARSIQSMVQPKPGQTYTSDQLRGVIAADPKGAVDYASGYVSGRCTIIKNNFVGRATKFPPKIEPAVLEEDKVQQAKQRRLFQFFKGIHNILNDEVQTTFQGTGWDRQVLEHLAVFGKCITMPYAQKEGKSIAFHADILDPLSTYHDFDSWPRRVVHDSTKGIEDARRVLKDFEGYFETSDAATNVLKKAEENQQRSVTMTDFWCEEPAGEWITVKEYRVWHGVLVEGKCAGYFETSDEHLPVVIVPVHASPGAYIDHQMSTASGQAVGSTRGVAYDRVFYHAESFLAPLYYINLAFEQKMSLLMEGLSRAMNPGEETVLDPESNEEPPTREQRGPGSHDVHGPGRVTTIQAQATAQIGEAARIFTEAIDKEFNRLYNEVLFGESSPGDSGYLNVNKVSHANAVVQETIRGASVFIKKTFDELAHQFVRSGLTFKVKAFRYKGQGAPQHFPGGDFTSKDLPDQYVLNVEVLADLPQNDAAKMDLFLAGAGVAFSKREGRVNILDNEDPDLTERLIEQEMYEASPPVQARRMLWQMRQEIAALEDAADQAKSLAERNAILLEAEYAKRDYQAATAQMQGQVQSATQPQGQPGMGPGTIPPEMKVGQNPDANAEARGQVSSYTGGKPRTAGAAA